MKFKKGDTVKIIRGKDAGKSGKISKALSKVNKIIVEEINQYKRHMKARSQRQPSEIVTIIKPIPVSNAVFVCPKCKLSARIGYSVEKGEKVRICKKCSQKI